MNENVAISDLQESQNLENNDLFLVSKYDETNDKYDSSKLKAEWFLNQFNDISNRINSLIDRLNALNPESSISGNQV